MLRLLHTADWHLGARFHDRDRSADEDDALDQLVRLCSDERVDVVLVAGDVFDTANPGADEQRRYFTCLERLVDEAGVAQVIVLAGNHDSGLRLEGPRGFLRRAGIAVHGRALPGAAPGDHVVAMRGRDGAPRAACVALPYLGQGDLGLAALADATERAAACPAALAARYAAARAAARSLHPALPLVVAGHCFAAGGQRTEGAEREIQVGNLGLVPAASLAGDAAYLALGHLHRPQQLGGNAHWRYSGSLLPAGFDETSRAREVVLADVPPDGTPAAVRRVALRPYRRYERLSGTEPEIRAALALLPPPDGAPEPWCELEVQLDGPRPGLAHELLEAAAARGWQALAVRTTCPAAAGADLAPAGERLADLAPEDLFARLHAERFGGPPDDALLAEFRDLVEDVRRGAEA